MTVIQMTKKTDCKRRMKLVQANYSERGCESHDMVGFACMAFTDEGIVMWMCGKDACMCEYYKSRGDTDDEQ